MTFFVKTDRRVIRITFFVKTDRRVIRITCSNNWSDLCMCEKEKEQEFNPKTKHFVLQIKSIF
jgi:hypothetical protein